MKFRSHKMVRMITKPIINSYKMYHPSIIENTIEGNGVQITKCNISTITVTIICIYKYPKVWFQECNYRFKDLRAIHNFSFCFSKISKATVNVHAFQYLFKFLRFLLELHTMCFSWCANCRYFLDHLSIKQCTACHEG